MESSAATPISEAELMGERRRGRMAGAAAVVGAFAFAAGHLWFQIANRDAPSTADHPAQALRFADDHAVSLVGGNLLQALGLLLLLPATVFLYRATKARWPAQNRIVLVTAIAGPVGLGIGTAVNAAILAHLASNFVGQADQTKGAAEDVYKSAGYLVAGGFSAAGFLAMLFWLIKANYDAMKVGLLTRIMGVVGMAVAPAMLFRLGLLLPVWAVALGFLLMRVWPGKLPEAWATGKASEWTGFGRALPLPPPQPDGSDSGGDRNGEVEAVGSAVKQPATTGEHRPRQRPRKRKRPS